MTFGLNMMITSLPVVFFHTLQTFYTVIESVIFLSKYLDYLVTRLKTLPIIRKQRNSSYNSTIQPWP